MAAATDSPSSSSSSTTTATNPNRNPIQSWWESISKARSTILTLSSILSLPSLSSLSDSDRPASSLLSSSSSYSAVSSALSSPPSGSGDDPLCQWLYETFQSPDPDLKLVVLSFVPVLVNSYLSRLISSPYSSSLSGYESVILTIYQSETRSRAGKPVLISIPDLSQPSLYHSPSPGSGSRSPSDLNSKPKVGILAPPLEPQVAVKSTKRAAIVGVALDCYFKKISLMPVRSKVDFCEFVVCWAGQDCSCRFEIDEETNSNTNSSCLSNFEDDERANGNCDGISSKGCRIPLPWELLQPVIRILGHCLLAPRNVEEVRDAASAAIRSVYARALHELMPQAILATRSLIRLDKSARKGDGDTMGMGVVGGIASNPTTPCKPKKPEVLLVSK